ncbi:MAG: diguanylate cyclase [Armatimonadota bacterium]
MNLILMLSKFLNAIAAYTTPPEFNRELCNVLEHGARSCKTVASCLRDFESDNLHIAWTGSDGHVVTSVVDLFKEDISSWFPEDVDEGIVRCSAEYFRRLIPDVACASEHTWLIPIRYEYTPVGCLILPAQSLTHLEIGLVKTIAELASLGVGVRIGALCRTRLFGITSSLSSIGPDSEMDAICEALVRILHSYVGTRLAFLYTIDLANGELHCHSVPFVSEEITTRLWSVTEQKLLDTNCGGDHSDVWICSDVYEEPFFTEQDLLVLQDAGVRSMISVLLKSQMGALGVLVACFGTPIRFRNQSDSWRYILTKLIAVSSSAFLCYTWAICQSDLLVENLAAANEKLVEEATTDALTGLPNHRAFQEKLHSCCQVQACGVKSSAFSLLMIDVDYFKRYNDTYGHREGDFALRAVAKLIASNLRQGDLAARYGGEEFAALLANVNKHEARAIAERVRLAVADYAFPRGKLSVSIGIAECPSDGITPVEIIEKADQALYHAKLTGRNRVVIWSSSLVFDSVGGGSSIQDEDSRRILVLERCSDGGISLPNIESYTVDVAYSDKELMDLLRTRKYALVLVVCKCGSAEDQRCLTKITSMHPSLPTVFVLQSPNVEVSKAALQNGAWDVVQLPTDPAELMLVVERNLERARVEKSKLRNKDTDVLIQAIEAMAAAIDARDAYTAGHSQRVTYIALAIADKLNLSSEERWALELAARLHDIGKLALPDSILNKQSALSEDEWHAMKQHPVQGSRIVGAIKELSYVSQIIRHHHEMLDGSGYPDGLCGEAIPYLSQIIAVADAYEAMTSERAHRDSLDPESALRELKRLSGVQYDPQVVTALEGVVAEVMIGIQADRKRCVA